MPVEIYIANNLKLNFGCFIGAMWDEKYSTRMHVHFVNLSSFWLQRQEDAPLHGLYLFTMY